MPLGEVFCFVSGLCFRGKLAYARRFGQAPVCASGEEAAAVHVITPNAGLRLPDTLMTADAVRLFADTQVDAANESYRRPLEPGAARLVEDTVDCDVVLLGSIASSKYVDVLLGIFGTRLLFPRAFVGRGDLSRGGLLLRHVASGEELEYIPVSGAVRRGTRPPRLTPVATPAKGAVDAPEPRSRPRRVLTGSRPAPSRSTPATSSTSQWSRTARRCCGSSTWAASISISGTRVVTT